MPARIIAFANQKGGVGKTTLCMSIAAALSAQGFRVVVADADPQGTAARWAAGPSCPVSAVTVEGTGGALVTALRPLVSDHDFVLVDCPPAATSDITQGALLLADLVVVPVIPSPPDIWAALAIREAIARARSQNPDVRALVVVNQLQQGTTLSRMVVELLDDFGLPRARTKIGQRVAFRESAATGQPLRGLGSKGSAAHGEIDVLTQEILDHLAP